MSALRPPRPACVTSSVADRLLFTCMATTRKAGAARSRKRKDSSAHQSPVLAHYLHCPVCSAKKKESERERESFDIFVVTVVCVFSLAASSAPFVARFAVITPTRGLSCRHCFSTTLLKTVEPCGHEKKKKERETEGRRLVGHDLDQPPGGQSLVLVLLPPFRIILSSVYTETASRGVRRLTLLLWEGWPRHCHF